MFGQGTTAATTSFYIPPGFIFVVGIETSTFVFRGEFTQETTQNPGDKRSRIDATSSGIP
jgi:hypothetical protein